MNRQKPATNRNAHLQQSAPSRRTETILPPPHIPMGRTGTLSTSHPCLHPTAITSPTTSSPSFRRIFQLSNVRTSSSTYIQFPPPTATASSRPHNLYALRHLCFLQPLCILQPLYALAPPLLRPPNHLYTQTGLPQPSEAHPAVKMIAPISTNLHYTRSVAHFTPQFKSSLHLNRPPTVLSGTSRCKDDRHLLRSDRPVAAE